MHEYRRSTSGTRKMLESQEVNFSFCAYLDQGTVPLHKTLFCNPFTILMFPPLRKIPKLRIGIKLRHRRIFQRALKFVESRKLFPFDPFIIMSPRSITKKSPHFYTLRFITHRSNRTDNKTKPEGF